MIFTRAILLLFILAVPNFVWSQAKDTTYVVIPDDPIIAMLDSLQNAKFFESTEFSTESQFPADYDPKFNPVFELSVIRERLAKLDAESPFDLVYNDAVKSYIEVYAKRKNLVSKMLGLAKIYFPLFEEHLDKYKMPLELKYLAIVESALNPNATSRVGASGLWQFMYPTGKMYKLNVTSYVDERRDPIKATDAACHYMMDLYKMYGDWQIVLAAYNSGPGNINKGIRRSGGKKTYWEIRPFLPRETQGYVPAFIAVNYIMNYSQEHNIYPVVPKSLYVNADTVVVKKPVNFDQISVYLGLPTEDLKYLNPSYKMGLIPATKNGNVLCIPKEKVGLFITNEEAIYVCGKAKDAPEIAFKDVKNTHTVRKGETLAIIGKKYNCTIDEIVSWNGLRQRKAVAGKKLTIYTYAKLNDDLADKSKDTVVKKENIAKSNTSENKSSQIGKSAKDKLSGKKFVYYTVQPGDTLWSIANKHKGTTVDEIKKWNNIKNSNNIKPGTKLKVGLHS
ncbi:MAG: LysM peptidoglycan-binding domain-containing protein [Bacteroidota bacterium]